MAFVAFQDLASTFLSFRFPLFNLLYTHPFWTPHWGIIPFACRIPTSLCQILAGGMWHPQTRLFNELLFFDNCLAR